MPGKKGIVRHESLYPLSHHHHHALFLALNLKRTGTEKSKQTTAETKQELKTFWLGEGKSHFREEEEILLPAYAAFASVEQPEIQEMLLEHLKIRSMIWEIDRSSEEPVSLMQELGQLLESHIRKEERIIFPMVEKALPEEMLKEIASLLHRNE